MGTVGGLERSYERDPYISPQSTYGYARHLGTTERSGFVLPRIRIPDEVRPDEMTLTPISFHIPRINSGETIAYGVQYIPPEHVNLPPVPPSVGDVNEYYIKQVVLPEGAILADPQLFPLVKKDLEERALNDNTALSFQTILFSLLRYPALICVFFGASSLWGRGKDVDKVGEEWEMGLASFCTGGGLLLLSLLLLSDHRNRYTPATILAWFRHAYSLLAVIGSVVIIVFAAMSISSLQKVKETCQGCLTPSERLTQLAVLIGSSALILMLALFALVMGCVGVYQMKGLLIREKKAREAAERAAHSNEETFHF